MAATAPVGSVMKVFGTARCQATTPAFRSTISLRGQAVCHRHCVRPTRSTAAARICTVTVAAPVAAAAAEEVTAESERLRLHNLAPQPGARRKNKRKGRGYGSGQGGTCGFGMRGQKSRSGPGVRAGFEGGQTPLYRRLPKLRGIAGGMPAGRPNHVTINLKTLAEHFDADAEVSLDILKTRRLLNVSGKQAKLPLKILGEGELSKPLTIHATDFSAGAREKIEAAGGKVVEVPRKVVWTQAAYRARKKAAAEAAAAKEEARAAAKAARKEAKAKTQ